MHAHIFGAPPTNMITPVQIYPQNIVDPKQNLTFEIVVTLTFFYFFKNKVLTWSLFFKLSRVIVFLKSFGLI